MSAPRLSLLLLLAIVLGAPGLRAQEGDWSITVAAPEGFRDLPGSGSGRRFIHRLPKLQERSRIDVGVIASGAGDLDAFLAAEKGGDRDGPDREESPEIAGRPAKVRVFLGSTELAGRRFSYERIVAACQLEPGRYLRVVATLYHLDDEPSARLKLVTRRGVEEVCKGLKATRLAATEAERTPPQLEVGERRAGSFGSEKILPFSFDYPLDWYLGYDDVESPGLLWILATPRDEDGFVPPEEDMQVALRVSVFGCVPELIGVDDELERACAFVRDDYTARFAKGRWEQVDEALLGNAKGRVFRYASAIGGREAGLVLVAVADSGLLIAEYRCRAEDFASREAEGRALLGSFEITPERGRTATKAGPFSFEAPEGFSVAEVGTEDASRAFVLRRAGLELFLRSYPLAAGEAPDEAVLRKLAAAYFADTLGLGAALEVERAMPLVLPEVVEGLRHFSLLDAAASDRRAVDLYAFVKRDALHLAILASKDGLRDHARGRLLEMLCHLEGPGAEPAPTRMGDNGRLTRRVCLRYFDPRPFADDGRLIGADRGALVLAPDGQALYEFRSATGVVLKHGSYGKVGDQLIVNFGAATDTLSFTWSSEERLAVDNDGRRWYPSTSF
ncbi:MAG: hypothetical protein H6807_16460 [Planctomycetes bacterium]|nr:hypothetical protein [Planctomycetota bacterium]